jgi:hypothetical protein
MVVLPGPYELLDLRDGQTLELRATGILTGEVEIHPRYVGAPASKIIKALRVSVDPATKPMGPAWWDITSQTLIAQLEPLIRTASKDKPIKVKLLAQGVAPAKRYSVELP